MATMTLSSQQLDYDLDAARKAAEDGPVFITDDGKPAHVLISISEYERLTAHGKNIFDLLSSPELSDIEFDPQPLRLGLRPADFS